MSHVRLAGWHWLDRWLKRFDLTTSGKWLVLSAMIGVIAGMGAIAFQFLGQGVQTVGLNWVAGYEPPQAYGERTVIEAPEEDAVPQSLVGLMAVLTVGGLISGLLVFALAPDAEGAGTDAAIDAFHFRRGVISYRIPLVKTLAAAITIGTGGSAGREGPIAQIGAGFGSLLATRLRLPPRDVRILLAAGMGAGVGALFRAPLAGALFAGEILYRDGDLEADVILPAAVSSTIAYSVYCLALPPELRYTPLFGPNLHFGFQSPLELIPYTLLALVVTLGGVLFIKTFFGLRTLLRHLPGPPHLRPAVGACLTGVVALAIYQLGGRNPALLAVLGTGYGTLQSALAAEVTLPVGVLLTVGFGKMLTTSLTVGSGGAGGVFGPSVVIGGCLGAAAGQVLHGWMPGLVPHPGAYAIVGMAGFFAGAARSPFSTILMVSEITGSYRLLLPTLWVASLCFLLNRRHTLYEKQVPTRLDSPAHRGDFIVDLLEGMQVGAVYTRGERLRKVPEAASLDQIVHLLDKTSQRYFPVVDADDRLVGIFSSDDVRAYLYDDVLWQIAIARDVMRTDVVTVTPDDDLNTALRYLTALNLDEIPVVDAEDGGHVLGFLRRREIIDAYNTRIIEHKKSLI